MQRPIEYQNLIKTGALEDVAQTPGALAMYLTNAQNYLAGAKQIDQKLSMQRFTSAYEGCFQLVQAVQEFYGVRAKASGRNLVGPTQVVRSQMNLDRLSRVLCGAAGSFS